MSTTIPAGKVVVFYDGVCGLCDATVQFLIARDQNDTFRFAPLQSEFGRQAVVERGGAPESLSSMYVIDARTEPNRFVSQGRAALLCVTALGGVWTLFHAARIIPTLFLNAGYRGIARLRYRFFGRLESCPVPSQANRRRFLG